jgi:hypothetical protein
MPNLSGARGRRHVRRAASLRLYLGPLYEHIGGAQPLPMSQQTPDRQEPLFPLVKRTGRGTGEAS